MCAQYEPSWPNYCLAMMGGPVCEIILQIWGLFRWFWAVTKATLVGSNKSQKHPDCKRKRNLWSGCLKPSNNLSNSNNCTLLWRKEYIAWNNQLVTCTLHSSLCSPLDTNKTFRICDMPHFLYSLRMTLSQLQLAFLLDLHATLDRCSQ